MYTRENLTQDLNALANHSSRGDDILQLRDELDVLQENCEDIFKEEKKDALGQEETGGHSGKTEASSTESG